MGANAQATIDFGAFPGKSDTSLAITGQAGIAADSEVEAWIMPLATADHTADEHLVERIDVFAGNIIPGTGFTIYAMFRGLGDTRAYGQWNVGWVWN